MLQSLFEKLFNWPTFVQVFGLTFEEGLTFILLLVGIVWIGYTRLLPARHVPWPDEWKEDSVWAKYRMSGILQFSLGWGLGVWVIAVLLFISLWLEEWHLDALGLGFGIILLLQYLNGFRLVSKNIAESTTRFKATCFWSLIGLLVFGLALNGTKQIFWCFFTFVLMVSFYKLILHPSYFKRLFDDLNLSQKVAKAFGGEIPLNIWISCVVALSAVVVFVCTIAYFLQHPHGGVDAYMIWNLHAKLMATGSDNWHRLFDNRWPWWNESHYPPLLPAVVSAGWYVAGSFSQWFPFLIACGFGLSTLGLLYGFLSRLKTHWVGVGAALILICTPFYWELLAQQLADVPLGYFVLAMLGSLIMGTGVPDLPQIDCKSHQQDDFLLNLKVKRKAHFQLQAQWILLSGCFAGLALLTKQEGLLLIFSCFTAWFFCLVFKIKSIQYKLKGGFVLGWLVGLCPALLMWFWYRSQMTGLKNIYFGQPWERMLLCLADLHRYEVIGLKFFVDILSGFSGPIGLFWFGVLWALFPKDWRPCQTGAFRFGLLVLVILGLLYTLTYLLTPYPLEWQLYFSARRLWIHLWPSMILLASWLIDWPGLSSEEDIQAS
jgi:hypothetical protein